MGHNEYAHILARGAGQRDVAARAFTRVLECRGGGPFDGERRTLDAGDDAIEHADGRYIARANARGEFLTWRPE